LIVTMLAFFPHSLLVVASFGVLFTTAAQAAETVKKREREAKKACLAGSVEKGAGILADLYVDTGDPTWLYNQGRCFEQNMRQIDAIGRFKEYLRKAPNITDAERNDVEKHIAECEAALAKTRPSLVAPAPVAPPPVAQPAVASPPPSPTEPPPAASSGTPSSSADAQHSAPPNEPAARSISWRVPAKWTAAGVSVVAAGLSVIEYVSYRSKGNEFNSTGCKDALPDKGGANCKALADGQDSAQVLSIIGASVAGAAAVAALVIGLTSPGEAVSPQAHAGISCVPVAGLLGMSCRGRF
jgi:hypothetical protein